MKKILFIIGFVLLTSCGPSQEEKQAAEMELQRLTKEASEKLAKEKANRTAAVTCAIMRESGNMDASIRVEKINEAREKIGGELFLDGDYAIKEAFKYGLCQELMLNEDYNKSLQPLKEAKRKRERIAAEKQIIADSKPTVKEEFHSNGKLRKRTNYQSKNVGGKKYGLDEWYHQNGQLRAKSTTKDGKTYGLSEEYHENGQLMGKATYKDGKRHGLSEEYYENGQLNEKRTYKDGERHGLYRMYLRDGKENFSSPYASKTMKK